jgi:hypothetical protein
MVDEPPTKPQEDRGREVPGPPPTHDAEGETLAAGETVSVSLTRAQAEAVYKAARHVADIAMPRIEVLHEAVAVFRAALEGR